jgi:hypothetical protein
MLTRLQKARFERNGFLLAPGVFSPAQVQKLRNFVIELFDRPLRYKGDFDRKEGGVPGVRFDVFARCPELSWLPMHPPMLAVLRGLLGRDFVFLPETAVHDSGFTDWHKDTGAQERAGLTFHWEPDFLMVQVGVYLQDNSPITGGGLDVIPGSHRRHGNIGLSIARHGLRPRMEKWLWGAAKDSRYSIPSKAGDLVLFHYRLDHQATQPAIRPVPIEHRKLAIFFACSVNNRHVGNYVDYISSRPDYVYLKEHRYSDDILHAARSQQFILL